MIKREFKVNFKSFLVWESILIGLFLIVFLVYPSITNSDNIKMIDEMMEAFPKEMLKAFNMDLSSIKTSFGWLKTEGFVLVLLMTGAYSGILGSSILLKEESDKTIEYLNSTPVTRNNILFSKVLCGFAYIILMVSILSIFNFIGLYLSGDFDKKLYILLSITPLFSSVVIFALCLFLSVFARKTKKTLGLSLGIVFISYVLNIISEMSESTETLKYLSIFTLADIRNVITNVSINYIIVLITILITSFLIFLTYIFYNKKEFV